MKMKQETKELKSVVEGFICKLIVSGKSYIDQKKLQNALTDCEVLKGTKEEISQSLDKVIYTLYYSRRIIPDVLEGKGFIITERNGEHEDAIIESLKRAPRALCSSRLYSHNEAKEHLNKMPANSRQTVDELYTSYSTNRYESRQIFGV